MDLIKQDREVNDIPSDGFSKVLFHSNDQMVIATSWDSSVSFYNSSSLELTSRLSLNAALLDCAVTEENSIVVAGLDRHVTHLSIERGEQKTLGDHDDAVRCLRYSSRLGLVVSGSWDRTVRTWDLRSATHWTGTAAVGGKVYAMALCDSLGYLVLSTDRTDLAMYDLRNMSEPIMRKESPLKYQTRCIEVNPNGQSYTVGSIEGRVAIEYFNSSPEVQAKAYAFKCHRKEDMGSVIVYPVNTISYNSLTGNFVTGGSDSFVNLWDGENKKRIWKLKQYPSAIASLAFGGEGRHLAIACSYMYEEGDIPNQPPVKLFIKDL